MDEAGVLDEVTRIQQFATYRQTITPPTQEAVGDLFLALLAEYRANKITGPITFNLNQGGVRNIIADQVANVREGSEADTVLEELFGRS